MIKTPLPSPRIAPALMLLAVLSLGPAAFAEEGGVYKVPPVAFGVGGLYGVYDFAVEGGDKNDGPGNVESSWSAGGGFVLELMLGKYFGLQTGLWFQHSEYVYEDDFKAFGENLLLPFYLLTSVNYGRLTLGLLAGVHLAHVTRSEFSGGGMSMDALKYINYEQAGVAGGIEMKLAIFRFVDLFVAVVGERYLTSFYEDETGSPAFLYGATVRGGCMFRTY